MGLRLWGPSRAALLRQAVAGFRHLVVGDSPVRGGDTRLVELPPPNHEAAAERLYRLLRELVYLMDTERFVPAGIEARDEGAGEASRVTVQGETFDPDRHSAWRQLKAVTRHQLEVRKAGEGGEARSYEATVIFDI